jgi:predicted RNA binding protein with dsRBD fold (UPF0201 family)/dephospho-CoA kinase
MRVIGTVGLPGSGKGEFANVAREHGVPVVTMGDVVRAETRARGLNPADHHGEVARALREEDGPLAIAERSLPMVRDRLDEHDTVVVDGLRSGDEAERFAEAFGDDFFLVAITAPDAVRAERLDLRARDNTEAESIADRDERELGFGMAEAIGRAALTVSNADSLDAFQRRAEAVLEHGIAAAEEVEGVERKEESPRTDGGDRREPDSGSRASAGRHRRPDGGVVYSVDVEITVPVMDTEVEARVRDAVEGLFPEAKFESAHGELRGEAHSLSHFSELLHDQQILDTARGQFFAGQDGDTCSFDLKKQAAFQGVVNFAVGNPGELGEIHADVTVRDPSVEAYVDHVAPPTEDGRPLG